MGCSMEIQLISRSRGKGTALIYWVRILCFKVNFSKARIRNDPALRKSLDKP